MISLIVNPVGIDKQIQKVQTILYEYLNAAYPEKNILAVGRAYKNQSTDGVTIAYFDSGEEYVNLFYDEEDIKYFFIDADNHTSADGFVYSANVKLVFYVNLSILPNPERADETFRKEIVSVLNRINTNRVKVTGVEKGLKNIFSGIEIKTDKTDMQPLHTFAVNLSINYHLMQKC